MVERTHSHIDTVIQSDKKYGIMKPINGEYFTWQALDTSDNEVSERMLDRGVKLAWQSWALRIPFKFKKAKPWETPDFKLIFRTPNTGERKEMKCNTIMYHYFPISKTNHESRGRCVINSDFHFTVHGEGVPMYKVDPKNYDKNSTIKASTIDLDVVLRHEFGHGLGLPHDPIPGNTMSTSYNTLNEFLQERDIKRIQAKYGVRQMLFYFLKRWLNYIYNRSDTY